MFIHKIITSTAADTSDFIVTDGLDALSAPGPRTLKCVTITAVDDRVPEGDEYITVSLSTSDPLVDIQHDSVSVTITDNGTIIVNEVCSYMYTCSDLSIYFPDPLILSAQEEVYTVIEGQFVTVCLSIPHNELPRTLVQLNALLSGGNGTGMMVYKCSMR